MIASPSMPNRVFIWRLSDESPKELDVRREAEITTPSDIRYHCGVLNELDRLIGDRGETILLTWHLDRFDERFNGSIALLIGDERYQIPSYAANVKAIFKTGGVRRNSFAQTLRLPWSIAWRNLLRDLRNDAIARRRRVNPGATPVFDLPLGYHKLVDVPFVPIETRPTDVFFAGALAQKMKLEVRPSIAARRQMIKALDAAAHALPQYKFDYSLNPLQGKFTPQEYSHNLMNAKIVLCPRGNFDETFRFFEAARSGCIAITEPLPERWYYQGSAAIQIRAWSELPATLAQLVNDPKRISDLSNQQREWWHKKASEPAVAQYMARQLRLDR